MNPDRLLPPLSQPYTLNSTKLADKTKHLSTDDKLIVLDYSVVIPIELKHLLFSELNKSKYQQKLNEKQLYFAHSIESISFNSIVFCSH